MNKKRIIVGGAAVTTTVTALTFVVFSVVYTPMLQKLSDRQFVERMQDINRNIQNPWFLGSFMGAVVLVPLAAYVYRKSGAARQAKLLFVASAIYIIGTFGITCAVNVPLNDKLATVNATSLPADELHQVRTEYESNWTNWHLVRTVFSVAAAGTVIAAIVIRNKSKKEV